MKFNFSKKFSLFIKSLTIKKLIFAYILLYSIMPIVAIATSTFLTTYSYMVIVLVTVMFTLFSCHLRDIKTFFFLLLPFIIFELLTIIVKGDPNFLLSGYQVLLFMMPVCLGYYLMNNPAVDYRLFTILLILCFGTTVLTTIIGCLSDPVASRMLATVSSSQDPSAVAYWWKNIGGFSFVYSAILLYPLVIFAFKKKTLHLVFTIIFTVMLFALAIDTAYTLALMLMMVSSILFFVRHDIPPRSLVLLIIGGFAFILVFHDLITSLLQLVAELIGNEQMGIKMLSVFGDTDAVNNLDDNRVELYMRSLTTFFKNPVLGIFLTGSERGIGGHSFLLDNLARFGLIGASLLFLMYRAIYKIFCKPYAGKEGYSFVLWTYAVTVILSGINTGMWLENLCIYVPLILCRIFQKAGESPLIGHHESIRKDAVKIIKSKEPVT